MSSLGSWFRGAITTVIEHRSTGVGNERSIEQNLDDLKASHGRVEKLVKQSGVQNVSRSVAFLGAGVLLASNPVMAEGASEVASVADTLDRSKLESIMSPASQALHKSAGAENLTIVSQDDKRIREIVAGLDDALIPDIRPPEAKDANPHHDSNIKRSLLTQYFDERLDRANAAFTSDHENNERVCFVQDTVPVQIPSDYDIPLVIGDKEMALGVLSHELAHCQDFNQVAVKDEHGHVVDEERQREVIADFTAGLLVSSHTKNWDFVDYSLTPMRAINVDNTDHATTRWLDRMRHTTDLDQLEPLSQKEAFELAQQKYERINYYMVQDRNLDDWVVNKGYKKAINGELSWDAMPDDFKSYYQAEHGVNSQQTLMPVLERHGNEQIGTYLNHVNYKSLESDDRTVNELLSYLNKHGKSFGNHELVTEVDRQRQLYAEKGAIETVPLGKSVGELIDLKAKGRFAVNEQKMADISRQFYPTNTVKDEKLVNVNEPFSDAKREAEMTGAKERFIDKVKTAEMENERDNDSELTQPG